MQRQQENKILKVDSQHLSSGIPAHPATSVDDLAILMPILKSQALDA